MPIDTASGPHAVKPVRDAANFSDDYAENGRPATRDWSRRDWQYYIYQYHRQVEMVDAEIGRVKYHRHGKCSGYKTQD